MEAALVAALDRFEKRLQVIKAFTRSVILGDHTGLYLSGPPGISKSWSVEEVFAVELSLVKDTDYYWHRGRLSMGGLLDLLSDYQGTEDAPKTIVLDDGHEVLHDRRCEPILLGALGRQRAAGRGRRIRYRTLKQNWDFTFWGGIIIISNQEFAAGDRVMDAIGTRCLIAELAPTDAEVEAKAFDIIRKKGDLLISVAEAEEVAAYCFARCRERGVRPTLRLIFDAAIPACGNGHGLHWQDWVDTIIQRTIQEPRHKLPSRDDETAEKKRVALEIVQTYSSRSDRLMAWIGQTGLKERAFYNFLRELKAEGKVAG